MNSLLIPVKFNSKSGGPAIVSQDESKFLIQRLSIAKGQIALLPYLRCERYPYTIESKVFSKVWTIPQESKTSIPEIASIFPQLFLLDGNNFRISLDIPIAVKPIMNILHATHVGGTPSTSNIVFDYSALLVSRYL